MAAVAPRRPTDVPAGIVDQAGHPVWVSDLILDVLRLLDIEYAATLPGNTFRGIHDSAVNYTANRQPELITCNHEMITVAMARGYAKATGRPMAVILHDFVGLLNAAMTIYDAWVDRAPVLILGGTEPLDAASRRAASGWFHGASIQGDVVRGFTKWDDQPASAAAVPESLLRAYRIAVTPPAGPVYVCFDAHLQEEELPRPFSLPNVGRYRPAAPPEADGDALREVARLLVGAELPVAFADRVGSSREAVQTLVELAELLAMPVINLGARCSFPTPHPLDFAGAQKELLAEADVLLSLDVKDLHGALGQSPPLSRSAGEGAGLDETPRVRGGAASGPTVISISLDEYAHRGLVQDCQALPAVDLPILGDAGRALPRLLEACQEALDGPARMRIERRRQALEPRQQRLRDRQRRYVEEQWDRPQVSEARLLAEVWSAIKDEDFVFTLARLGRMAPGVCAVPGPERNVGLGGGGAVGSGPGVALGAALALKDSGKLPVAILGDGELLASNQALWTAAHYSIPSLWVINNNRSYFNDEDHQEQIATIRDRPIENRWIGERLEDPAIDFVTMARAFGLPGEGPIRDAAVLVDVWTENRPIG